MALNLSRSSKLYVSLVNSSHTANDTFRVNILDGYSFSQDTATQEITLNEAGDAPIRGQKQFNTALNPAEFSFTTYVRPYTNSSNHDAVERLLWEALVGYCTTSDYSATGGLNTVPGTTNLAIDFENSDVHELTPLYLYFELDSTTYRIDEAQINQAEIDFSIDGIAQITWSGQGTAITEATAPATYTNDTSDASAVYLKNKLSTLEISREGTGVVEAQWTVDYQGGSLGLREFAAHTLGATTAYTCDITIDGGTLQTITVDTTTFTGTTIGDVIDEMNEQLEGANITISSTGDLLVTSHTAGTASTVLVADGGVNALLATLETTEFNAVGSETTNGAGTATEYNVPITGGSLTINNNTTFLTPEELATVNTPIGSFTGTRAISGSLTAYLNTGSGRVGSLLSDMLSATDTTTHDFTIVIHMGGPTGARVDFTMNHANLTIPSINVEDVISTEIAFTALGQDLEVADELKVEYYAS